MQHISMHMFKLHNLFMKYISTELAFLSFCKHDCITRQFECGIHLPATLYWLQIWWDKWVPCNFLFVEGSFHFQSNHSVAKVGELFSYAQFPVQLNCMLYERWHNHLLHIHECIIWHSNGKYWNRCFECWNWYWYRYWENEIWLKRKDELDKEKNAYFNRK